MKRIATTVLTLLATAGSAHAATSLPIAAVASSTVRGVPFGAAMGDAGDVNGDGVHDLVIGGGPAGMRSSSNSAFVVFGRRRPFRVDLRALGRDGIRIDGEAIGDGTGAAVAGAGDINGDGLGDLLVGAPGARRGAGAAYLIAGRRTHGSIDLSDPMAALLRVDGRSDGAQLGAAVARAGDVNADKVPDLLIGSPGASGARVVFGRRDWSTGTVLGDDAAQLLVSGSGFDLAGAAVAGLGDVNGDGRDDIAVGAPAGSFGLYTGQGVAYVVFGRAGEPVDLTALARGGFRIIGDYGGTGMAVAGPGDVNGDDRPDVAVTSFAVGSDGDYDGGFSSAVISAALVFGSSSAADVLLADPVPRFIRLFQGRRQVRPSVTGVGDLNHDGRADMLSGGADKGGAPSAFLTYGRSGVRDGYDVRFTGARTSRTGVQTTSIGDLNGDRRPELVFAVGPSGGSPGRASIVHGLLKPAGACLARRRGTSGADRIDATPGGDRLEGLGGNDLLVAGAGADCVTGGSGRDVISAGLGNDRVNVRDGERDVVNCGPGTDRVTADRRDRLTGCEKRQR